MSSAFSSCYLVLSHGLEPTTQVSTGIKLYNVMRPFSSVIPVLTLMSRLCYHLIPSVLSEAFCTRAYTIFLGIGTDIGIGEVGIDWIMLCRQVYRISYSRHARMHWQYILSIVMHGYGQYVYSQRSCHSTHKFGVRYRWYNRHESLREQLWPCHCTPIRGRCWRIVLPMHIKPSAKDSVLPHRSIA